MLVAVCLCVLSGGEKSTHNSPEEFGVTALENSFQESTESRISLLFKPVVFDAPDLFVISDGLFRVFSVFVIINSCFAVLLVSLHVFNSSWRQMTLLIADCFSSDRLLLVFEIDLGVAQVFVSWHLCFLFLIDESLFLDKKLIFFGIVGSDFVKLALSLFVFNWSCRRLISLISETIISGGILSVFEIFDLGVVELFISWRMSWISLVVEFVSSIFGIDNSFFVQLFFSWFTFKSNSRKLISFTQESLSSDSAIIISMCDIIDSLVVSLLDSSCASKLTSPRLIFLALDLSLSLFFFLLLSIPSKPIFIYMIYVIATTVLMNEIV